MNTETNDPVILKPAPFDFSNFLTLREEYLDLHIYPNGLGYLIEYKRMDTPEKLLGWIYHLLKKETVTKEHIRAFIEAANRRGVTINFDA
jgi:hypothetical protein